MCDLIGEIITVKEANRREEDKAKNNTPSCYCYYWRTSSGKLRKTGFVRICKCGQSQKWAARKKDLEVKNVRI